MYITIHVENIKSNNVEIAFDTYNNLYLKKKKREE